VSLIGNAAAILAPEVLQELENGFSGDVMTQEHPRYDDARKVWNGMVDRHPALILRCVDTADVLAGVDFARTTGLTVAVRGGGHNVAGNAVCDGGILIDLGAMTGVRVDPVERIVDVQAGAQLGHIDHALHAFGLATPVGVVSKTGLAGLTLGGGVGHLQRKHGLTIDNLISVDVVTADGRFLIASEDENEDLFWGLKGGGGNFGIATSFRFRAHPVGTVLAGPIYFEARPEVLARYFAFTKNAPRNLGTIAVLHTAAPFEFLPVEVHGKHLIAVVVCFAGSMEDGEKALEPLRKLDHVIADLAGPMPYTALQTMFDAAHPRGDMNYWKTEFLADPDEFAAQALIESFTNVPSPLSSIEIQHGGGAIRDVPDGDAAYAYRKGDFSVSVSSKWKDSAENDRHIAWTRSTWASMKPWSAGGGYVNYLDADEDQQTIERAYGAEKYRRLAQLKRKYDPDNFFSMNHNIKPA
jgi:FAD/FMN-containing dehydrogenase